MTSRSSNFPGDLPASLAAERQGTVAVLLLNRPHKRNALSDETSSGSTPSLQRAAGRRRRRGAARRGRAFLRRPRPRRARRAQRRAGHRPFALWHRAFEQIQFGRVPVVAVLHGAVVGGGLELAAAAHVRVAERRLLRAARGQRGLFVGGGGSVRMPRLIGVARMTDMMLTGRVYSAEEGQAIGISQYLVEPGKGLAKGSSSPQRIAGNAPLSNFAVMHALPRIAEMRPASGSSIESLMAAIAQGDEAAKSALAPFSRSARRR